jgi:VWFA-related protein
MKRIMSFAFFLCILSVPIFPQQPSPIPPISNDQVVKISTDLIQIDVTVTNKNGKVVTDLKPEDFEIFENGERQKISNFSFVSKIGGQATVVTDHGSAKDQASASTGGVPQASTGTRTIAIVVDDLNMSFGSIYSTRQTLKRFVDEQMQPGDLVAIVRTAGGVGALQQFTSDKKLLHAAMDAIRWRPFTSNSDPLEPISQNAQDITDRFKTESSGIAGPPDIDTNERVSGRQRTSLTQDKARDFNYTKNTVGLEQSMYVQTTLGITKFVIGGMNARVGRKLMMFFSDGFQIGNDSNKSRSSAIFGVLRDLADYANRSSVVVDTFDTRGLRSTFIEASDSTYEIIDGHRGEKEKERVAIFKSSQDGLAYFAEQTGGEALLNNDDLNGGIQRALDAESGYYLLAYQPNGEDFDPGKRRFNKLEVTVHRPGLKVNYRSGFFSTPSGPSPQQPSLPVEQQIVKALTSPFASNDIALSANAMFADDADNGSYIRSFLHIDAKDLKFVDDADGSKKATFDVAAVTFSADGAPVENMETTYTIKTRGATYTAMLQKGFVYVLIMPVKKPGLYHYRIALRDEATGKIGSASQIVNIPDLSKQKLTLSSLAVENVSMNTWQNITQGRVGSKPGQTQVVSTLLYDTVLKQFQAGTVLRYGCEIYNAKMGSSQVPRLETQAKILYNDKVVIDGNVLKFDEAQANVPKPRISGAILLKDTLQPGDYVLQLTVRDTMSKQVAIELFPFEIVK